MRYLSVAKSSPIFFHPFHFQAIHDFPVGTKDFCSLCLGDWGCRLLRKQDPHFCSSWPVHSHLSYLLFAKATNGLKSPTFKSRVGNIAFHNPSPWPVQLEADIFCSCWDQMSAWDGMPTAAAHSHVSGHWRLRSQHHHSQHGMQGIIYFPNSCPGTDSLWTWQVALVVPQKCVRAVLSITLGERVCV